MSRCALCVVFCVLSTACCFSQEKNLIVNGSFEELRGQWPAGWDQFWMREPGAGKATVTADAHTGARALRISHTGQRDWSLHVARDIPVRPGDIFLLSAWTKCQGQGGASLSVVTIDRAGKTLSWIWNPRAIRKSTQWQKTTTHIVVPEGCARIRPRIVGTGPVVIVVDDVALIKRGNVLQMQREANLPERITLSNKLAEVAFLPREGQFELRDKRTNQRWTLPRPADGPIVISASGQGGALSAKLLDPANDLDITLRAELASDKPELTITLSAEGELARPLHFPGPVLTAPGQWLVVPLNEGILYPVDDQTIRPPGRLIGYGGHGICMSWWGVTDMRRGVMAIIETPDDMSIRIARDKSGLLNIRPEWEASKGQFAYPRRLTFVLFDDGGYVAQAKRYRQYAKQVGKFRTLREKAQFNANVRKLYGAVDVWIMDWRLNVVDIAHEFKRLGMERALFNIPGYLKDEAKAAAIDELNRLGFLTGRYDIYQDLMPPDVAKKHNLRHSCWTQEAWPQDIVIGPDGNWVRGWVVKRGDQSFPCAVLCDRQALKYAKKRIPADLAKFHYTARFIDTTTASPWRECYHPDHPMTRSESRRYKMELLRYVSEEMKLVTGTETGIDPSVPYVHYYEGMLSLGPYRVPDAGRNMIKPWEPIERIVKFQVGHYYRVPLWELVYHDCTVATWYWGDYNNKVPAVWDRRDLFNLLYGTPPMFMFNKEIWEKYRERFVQSYNTICPTVAKLAELEMTSHEFLTEDHTVQRTIFADGTQIVVNFGEKPFRQGGLELAPMSAKVIAGSSLP